MTYIISLILVLWIAASGVDLILYNRSLKDIPIRIHVNGIRGKSSIVRYIASILRSRGYRVLGKTTGTAPRVIDFSGEEMLLRRAGQPNISEQLQLMKYFIGLKPEAVVVECMAINPTYARWLENKVMKSNIYILTNVRIDHQDQLGHSLESIALSLCQSLPANSVVITGESNPPVLEIIKAQCKKLGTKLIAPCEKNDDFSSEIDISAFTHVPILENIRVCIAFASLLNINARDAIAAMAETNPDPGHLQLQSIACGNVEIAWANLFAVNDQESFAEWVKILTAVHSTHYPVVILNNRKDRADRLPVFCSVIQQMGIKSVVTFGDLEDRVCALVDSDCRVLRLGNSSKYVQANGEQLLNAIAEYYSQPSILLIGAINIHSRQADQLLAYLADVSILSESDDGFIAA